MRTRGWCNKSKQLLRFEVENKTRTKTWYIPNPGHLRPVIVKPVGRIFEMSDSNPTKGKPRKCGRSLSPQKNKSLRRFHGANLRKTRTKTRKMQKMRLTGLNVTGFRPHQSPVETLSLSPAKIIKMSYGSEAAISNRQS